MTEGLCGQVTRGFKAKNLPLTHIGWVVMMCVKIGQITGPKVVVRVVMMLEKISGAISAFYFLEL